MGGSSRALAGLRISLRSIHAWVIPQQTSIPNAHLVFDRVGHPKDKELDERLKEVGREVARFAYLRTSDKTSEFLEAWEQAPVNPGGGEHVE